MKTSLILINTLPNIIIVLIFLFAFLILYAMLWIMYQFKSSKALSSVQKTMHFPSWFWTMVYEKRKVKTLSSCRGKNNLVLFWHWLSFFSRGGILVIRELDPAHNVWMFSSLSADGPKWRQQATLHCQLPPTSIWLAANDACVWLLQEPRSCWTHSCVSVYCVGRVENWHDVFYTLS